MKDIYYTFGFTPNYFLSTRPDEAMGAVEDWNLAEKSLKSALEENKLDYIVNEKDGAFYGPKIDVHIKDALNRTWQLATVQLDYQLPERFDLTFEGSDGKKHRPVMIHRAIYGSYERFMGIITEHFAGAFPVWFSPVQVIILTITDSVKDYGENVLKELKLNCLRAELDSRNEKIGYKIREAENRKIPFMLVIGDKEKENSTVAVRQHKKGDTGKIGLKEFIQNINLLVKEKSYNY
jgi:threonyl-tRNA synthetase